MQDVQDDAVLLVDNRKRSFRLSTWGRQIWDSESICRISV